MTRTTPILETTEIRTFREENLHWIRAIRAAMRSEFPEEQVAIVLSGFLEAKRKEV